MNQDHFEAEVVSLAAEGVKLTVANVAARTGLPLRGVEGMLDTMVGSQLLDSEVDEAHGIVAYRVRGLDPGAARSRLAVLEREVDGASPRFAATRPRYVVAGAGPRDKSVIAGTALAAVFGPLGLLYAGPLEEVALGFMGFVALLFASSIPLIGRLAGAFIPFVWLVSIGVQIVYVARFNANGQRTGLLARGGLGRRFGR
ncbi:MAG: hypothetical protein ACLQVI_25030 [Polyangiaceae bacterium]|jgi:hypothetical protein